MKFANKVKQYYIKAIEGQEALGAKPSSLDTSRHILNTIHKTVYNVDSLSRDDHHPEVKKAFDHVKKLYDKHSSILNAEIQKLTKNPQPSPKFTEALKEIAKKLKSLSGPNTKVDIKTKSTAEKVDRYGKDIYILYSRSIITLSRDGKHWYISCYEQWIPENDYYSYGVHTSNKEQDLNQIKLKDYPKETLSPNYEAIEDHMLEYGYKEAKGKNKHKLIRSQFRSLFPEAKFKETETDIVFNIHLEEDLPEFRKEKLVVPESAQKSIERSLKDLTEYIKKLGGDIVGAINFEAVDSYDGQGYSNYPTWDITKSGVKTRMLEDEGTPKGWYYHLKFSISFSKKSKITPEDLKKIHSYVKELQTVKWSSRRSYW